MLLRKGRDVGKVVWALGGEVLASHIDVERMKKFLGEQHKVDQFALHSGRIEGATRLAEMRAQPWVIQREGRWASLALIGYVRSNMEDLLWVSRILVGRSGAPSRQPGQRTRWGGKGWNRIGAGVEPGFRMFFWLLRLCIKAEGRSAANNSWERKRGMGRRQGKRDEGEPSFPHTHPPPRRTP